MKHKKVLWPIDFSRNIEKAFPFIKDVSQDKDTEIHVLYVINDFVNHEPWYGEFKPKHNRDYSSRLSHTAEKRLEHICEKYVDGCPLFIRHTAKGKPSTEILKFIKDEDVDLVVMTHQDDPERINSSHTFETVFENSPVPVKTIRVHASH